MSPTLGGQASVSSLAVECIRSREFPENIGYMGDYTIVDGRFFAIMGADGRAMDRRTAMCSNGDGVPHHDRGAVNGTQLIAVGWVFHH